LPWCRAVPDDALPSMDQIVIRPARTEDTPGMARLVDTYRAALRGQVPDHVLDAVPLDQANAGSERNWRRTIDEGGVPLQETMYGWMPEEVSRLLATHAPGHGRPAERRS
jgi:hypothetical protein